MAASGAMIFSDLPVLNTAQQLSDQLATFSRKGEKGSGSNTCIGIRSCPRGEGKI